MNRKSSLILEIVLWSIVAAILSGFLIHGLIDSTFSWSALPQIHFGSSTNYTYSDSSSYQSGTTALDADKIQNLNIDWIDGSVTLEVGSDDTISLSETCSTDLDEKQNLRYLIKNGTLYIKYCAPMALAKTLDKKLIITLPQSLASSLKDISVDCTSADLNIQTLTAESLTLDSTSGKIETTNTTLTQVKVDSTSGNADLSGSFGKVDFDSTSGDLTVKSITNLSSLSADCTSGNITLNLPEDNGFTSSYDTISGDFDCDFPVTTNDSTSVYGDGSGKFSVDSTSGDFCIRKN